MIHDEPRVELDSKIVDDVARLQDGADGLHVTSSKEVAGAQPDELGLFGVQSLPIRQHPGLHRVDDVHGSGSQISGICRLTRALKLCIVSIQMHAKSELYNQSLNIGRIENVEERAEHRALRHTRTHDCATRDRYTVMYYLRACDRR